MRGTTPTLKKNQVKITNENTIQKTRRLRTVARAVAGEKPGARHVCVKGSRKLLIAQRQKALAKWGKTSANYKQLRNRVQEACSKCKKRFYENKVSGLQDSNLSRWWKDIKELGDLSCPGGWSSQLIGGKIPDEATQALKFNEFLGSLTAHFRPLEPLSPVFGPVLAHLYVSERTVYKTLRALKVKKSPGPELIPNIVWK